MLRKFLYILLLLTIPSVCSAVRVVQPLLLPPYGPVPGDMITLRTDGASDRKDATLVYYQTGLSGQFMVLVVDWKFPFTISELLGTNSDARVDSAKFYFEVSSTSAAWPAGDKKGHLLGRCTAPLNLDTSTYANYTIVWDALADTTRLDNDAGQAADLGTANTWYVMDCTKIIQDAANGEDFNGIALKYPYDGTGGLPYVDCPQVSVFGAHISGGIVRPYIKIWFSYETKPSFWTVEQNATSYNFDSFRSIAPITVLAEQWFSKNITQQIIPGMQFVDIDTLDNIPYSSIQSSYLLLLTHYSAFDAPYGTYAVRPFTYKWSGTAGTWNNALGEVEKGGWNGTDNSTIAANLETVFGAALDSVYATTSYSNWIGCGKWLTLPSSLVSSWHAGAEETGYMYGIGVINGTSHPTSTSYGYFNKSTGRLMPYLIVTFNYTVPNMSKPKGPMGTKNMGMDEGIK